MPARGRNTASRASSTMIASHVDLIRRPKPPQEATVFDTIEGREYVVARNGSRVYLADGCRHMAVGRGTEPTRVCRIPECRANMRALRGQEAAETAETDEA